MFCSNNTNKSFGGNKLLSGIDASSCGRLNRRSKQNTLEYKNQRTIWVIVKLGFKVIQLKC